MSKVQMHYSLCSPCCSSCPTIYTNENKDFIVIGKHTTAETRTEIADKIASDEDTVTLPRNLLLGYLAQNWSELEAEVKKFNTAAA